MANPGYGKLTILTLVGCWHICTPLFHGGLTCIQQRSGDQNWDWRPSQQKNLVVLKILQQDRPNICMVTEGGIIA